MAVVAGGSKCNLITHYSKGGDVDIDYGHNVWLAQTFTLENCRVLFRLRVKNRTVAGGHFYEYALRATDDDGKPTGEDLQTTTLAPTGEAFTNVTKWRRFDFRTIPVFEIGKYAVIVSVPDEASAFGYKLRADETSPTYAGGSAYRSTDSGKTWVAIPDTCFLFEVWGWSAPPDGTYIPLNRPFLELWGDTLTQNNPWVQNLPANPVNITLADGLITLDTPPVDMAGIKCEFTPNVIPLVNPDGINLHLRAVSTNPPPLTHDARASVFIYTSDGDYNYWIEAIITRGDWWGPWGDLKWGGIINCGLDYGLDPGRLDLCELWKWGRDRAGLPNDPTAWYVTKIVLGFETIDAEPNPYITNNSLDLFYDRPPITDPFVAPPRPPAPMPEPVISNWGVIDITYEDTYEGVVLSVTTDIECHLYMRWTHEQPLTHKIPVMLRGIKQIDATRWCFVSFHENEQAEDGDTKTHTFTKAPWNYCETRYFYFIGTKQTEEQPSASPVMKYHKSTSPPHPSYLTIWNMRWTTYGSVWQMSDLLFFSQGFYVSIVPLHVLSAKIFFNTKTDVFVSVAIHHADADFKPIGLALDTDTINLKDGVRWCSDIVFTNTVEFDVILPPNLNYALVIKPDAWANRLWSAFRLVEWECSWGTTWMWRRDANRSIDGGLTWNYTTRYACFQIYGHYLPSP